MRESGKRKAEMGRTLLAALYFLVSAVCCPAKDVYISESGAGAQDGAACASAHSIAWMNDPSNWSQTANAAKIAWGDVVRLCGTITSPLSFTGGGDAGFVYTLYWEPDTVVEAGTWTGNGWYYASGRTYVTFDGGQNGVIRCTNSGSPNTGLTSTNGSAPAIHLISCNNLTIKNLTITNLYVRAKGPYLQGGSAIWMKDETGASGGHQNITVSNCVVSHAAVGVNIDYGPAAYNILITANTFSNVNWGAGGGDRNASSVLTNITFSNNRVWAFTAWDGTELDALEGARAIFHHNGCYFWAESGGDLKEVNIFGNHVGPAFSTQTDGSSQATAAYFISGNCSGPLSVYNNIAEQEGGVDAPGNGFIALGGTGINRVFNNTFVSKTASATHAIQVSGAAGNLTLYVSNNIVTNSFPIWIKSWTAGDNAYVDNNIYWPDVTGFSKTTTGSSDNKTFSFWQGTYGLDTHGTNLNPLLTSTSRLSAGSPAIGYGANLNSFFTTDYDGLTRGSVWDAGAFEFVAPDLTRTVNVSGTLRVGTMTVP